MASQRMNLSLNILKCCCCNEIPWSEVFQCKNGHLICDKCYLKDSYCSKCKVELASEPEDKIRIPVLEHVLDSMEFDCRYKERGCEETLTRNKMLDHLGNCDYRPRLVQICKQIGLQCDFTVSNKKMSEAVQHFQEVHGFRLCVSKEVSDYLVSISLKNVVSVDDVSSSQDTVWTPVIIKLGNTDDSPVFLLLGVFKENEKNMQMLLWFFGDPASAGKYRGNFQISTKHSPLIPKLSWSEHPCEVWTEGVDLMTSASFKIPTQFLQQFESPNNSSIALKMVLTGSANGNKDIPEREAKHEISIDRLCLVKVSEPSCNNDSLGSASTMETEDGDEDEIESETLTATLGNASSTNQVIRKGKIGERENQNDAEDADKAVLKNGVLDMFSFSTVEIARMIKEPKQMKQYYKCKLAFSDEMSSSKILKVLDLFHECGDLFEELFVSMPCLEENFLFLEQVLQTVPNLCYLIYEYQHGQDAFEFLTILKVCWKKGKIPELTDLKLVGASGNESLKNKHIKTLSKVGIKFKSLEIGDSLWEDVKPEALEQLMQTCKSSLEVLIIHGGFRGKSGETQKNKVLTFPEMAILSRFFLCPYYDFYSEFNNTQCKKARMVNLDRENEPIKITVQFKNCFPSLKFLALGNSIEVEDLYFPTVRNLTTFRCGNHWNLSIQFPSEFLEEYFHKSNVTSFQFPDALQDPSFPEKVAKHFDKIRKVFLYLPSVAVLQAFFKAFENSSVERLFLGTQFDFASLLESCLFPGITTLVQDQDEVTKSLIKTFKEYKHFEEYAAHHNLDLPSDQIKDASKTISPGISGLKNLKALLIRHIPRRKLLIPVKHDGRKWYDPKCRFMNTTFGFHDYPLTYQCHLEILKLNLEEYTPIRMICKSAGKLYEGRKI